MKTIKQTMAKTKINQDIVLLGFCLLTVLNVKNQLGRKQQSGSFPFLTVFSMANFLAFSLIAHKEERFLSMVFPLFGVCFGLFWVSCLSLERRLFRSIKNPNFNFSVVKLLLNANLFYFTYNESLAMAKNYLESGSYDREVYNLLNGRSDIFRRFKPLNRTEELVDIQDVSSIWISDKYFYAATLNAHIPGADKITIIHNCFEQPDFLQIEHYVPLSTLQQVFPELKFQSHVSGFGPPIASNMIDLIQMVNSSLLPQVLVFTDLYPHSRYF